MRILILAAAGAALAASPALAKESKPADPDKKICRFENQSASRLARKICKTAAEWKAEQEDGRKGVDATYRPIETRD